MDDWVYLGLPGATPYWANVRTGATQWEAPVASAPLEEPEKAYAKFANGWLQYTDEETGTKYFYNKNTQETQWDMPPDADPGAAGSAAPDAAEDDASSDEDLPPPLPEQLGQLSIDQRKQEDDEREKKREKRAAQRLKILRTQGDRGSVFRARM